MHWNIRNGPSLPEGRVSVCRRARRLERQGKVCCARLARLEAGACAPQRAALSKSHHAAIYWQKRVRVCMPHLQACVCTCACGCGPNGGGLHASVAFSENPSARRRGWWHRLEATRGAEVIFAARRLAGTACGRQPLNRGAPAPAPMDALSLGGWAWVRGEHSRRHGGPTEMGPQPHYQCRCAAPSGCAGPACRGRQPTASGKTERSRALAPNETRGQGCVGGWSPNSLTPRAKITHTGACERAQCAV
jgi:hypothetical protein